MDPLSSLSVASSAIQIFDFSSKLWKQIRELYQSESGATRAQETALIDAGRLCNLNSGLSKLLTPENLQRQPTTTEENIVSMCNECGDAAGQLVKSLQKLTLDVPSDVSNLGLICFHSSCQWLNSGGSDRGINGLCFHCEEAEGHPTPREPTFEAPDIH